MHVSSKDSGKTRHLHRLTRALDANQHNKYQSLLNCPKLRKKRTQKMLFYQYIKDKALYWARSDYIISKQKKTKEIKNALHLPYIIASIFKKQKSYCLK